MIRNSFHPNFGHVQFARLYKKTFRHISIQILLLDRGVFLVILNNHPPFYKSFVIFLEQTTERISMEVCTVVVWTRSKCLRNIKITVIRRLDSN